MKLLTISDDGDIVHQANFYCKFALILSKMSPRINFDTDISVNQTTLNIISGKPNPTELRLRMRRSSSMVGLKDIPKKQNLITEDENTIMIGPFAFNKKL